MGRFIVKLVPPNSTREFYLEWSTIVDAPVTGGMELEEFKEWYREEHGRIDYDGLQYRLARVEQHGTSSIDTNETPETIIAGNRAGPNESTLTMDEIIAAYCIQHSSFYLAP